MQTIALCSSVRADTTEYAKQSGGHYCICNNVLRIVLHRGHIACDRATWPKNEIPVETILVVSRYYNNLYHWDQIVTFLITGNVVILRTEKKTKHKPENEIRVQRMYSLYNQSPLQA